MIDNADAATLQLNYELNNNDLRIQLTEILKTIESYDVVDVEELEKVFFNQKKKCLFFFSYFKYVQCIII